MDRIARFEQDRPFEGVGIENVLAGLFETYDVIQFQLRKREKAVFDALVRIIVATREPEKLRFNARKVRDGVSSHSSKCGVAEVAA